MYQKSEPKQAKELFKRFWCALSDEPYVLIVCGSRYPSYSSKTKSFKDAAEWVEDFLGYVAKIFPPFAVVQRIDPENKGVDFISNMVFSDADIPVSGIACRATTKDFMVANKRILETARAISEGSGSNLLCISLCGSESIDAKDILKECMNSEIHSFEVALNL